MKSPSDKANPDVGSFAAVVVAAGRGERAGQADGPKQYRAIGGQPVLRRTLTTLLANPRIAQVAVAIHPDDEALFAAAAAGLSGNIVAVHGGATRQASTLCALEALVSEKPFGVLIHDGVRPFAGKELIDRVIAAVAEGQGALPALAVSDTLKKADTSGAIQGTVPRDGLFAAQTPQGFVFADILAAHRKAVTEGRDDFTDDAAIAEWAGITVRIVEGSPDNVKLTWARDLRDADLRLAGERAAFPDIRTGNGYDVHSFTDGDHVMLCGVSIPHDRKLSGHSDADVGLHALTDALLATCGEGDIGSHFPPSDPQWKGAASHIFVEHAARLVRARGGRIANADVTLICEAPRIGPHRQLMCEAIAAMLGIETTRVSVKATTNEQMGFIGRGEGIAAIATATVAYPGAIPE
jgi:2-C-methyl-D-erythritol 4-phosphate cytidylyltransferase/2-C-methyl-D-erythritol 2,4-cyclodiphosphate synthase